MRGVAAALGAVALLAAGACQPSSLTPAWIEERGPEDYASGVALDGNWEGITTGGGLLRFQVASGAVADIYLFGEGPCGAIFTLTERVLIEGRGFAVTRELASGGFMTVGATFTTRALAEGSYAYSGTAIVEGCPRDGSGTFTAAPTL